MVQEHFDVVVVGSGFGSLFFVEGYLSRRPAAKILMLERGTFNSHAWQLEQNKNSPIVPGATFRTDAAQKVWNFTTDYQLLKLKIGVDVSHDTGLMPHFSPIYGPPIVVLTRPTRLEDFLILTWSDALERLKIYLSSRRGWSINTNRVLV